MKVVFFALCLLLSVTARAQQPAPQQQSLEGMIRACQAVATELTAARELIEQQRRELAALDERLKAEQSKTGAQQDSLAVLKEQLANLQAAYDKLEEAHKLRAEEVEMLKKQLTVMASRLKLSRRLGTALGIGLVIAVAAGSRN